MIVYLLQGCVDAIIDEVSDQIGIVAGVSVTILIMMVRSEIVCWKRLFENDA